MEFRIAYYYLLGEKIGRGAFGDIFRGTDIRTQSDVAIKLESVTSKSLQLGYEAKAYQYLKEGAGVPRVYYYGKEETYNVMIMDLMGPSLESLFRYCNGHFSLKTVCMLAQEMILRLEFIHEQGFIHRDIKPDNFVIGMHQTPNLVYVIDLGLCKRYCLPSSGNHIPYRECKNLTGTPRYASIADHLGIEQSRRDDLESLGYVLIYFLQGRLPWQGVKAENKKDKYMRIFETKETVSVQELCSGLPIEFQDYLVYCRGLRYAEDPDYNYLRGLFRSVMVKYDLPNDGVFDWMEDSGPRNIEAVPDFCRTPEGTLCPCFLQPAPPFYTDVMLRSELNLPDYADSVDSSSPIVISPCSALSQDEIK